MIINDPELTYGKDAYWFSHDSNARNDNKCMKLRRVLGMEGYGTFWALVEMLREASGYKLPLSSVTDIAYELRLPEEKILAVINNFDLFQVEEGQFFSLRLVRSMEKLENRRNLLSESGRKGGLSSAKARVKQASSIIVEESIVDDSKVNKSIVEESKEKTLDWFVEQIDEIFLDNLKATYPGKDIPQAVKEAYMYVASDSLRLHNLDGGGVKKLVNTWLANTKNNGKARKGLDVKSEIESIYNRNQ